MVAGPDRRTLALLAGLGCLCLAALAVDFDTVSYRRELAGEWWRLFTAPFAHYGALHAAGNLAALAVLGVAAGHCLSHRRLAVLVVVTLAGSMTLLHVGLDQYRVYAGMSPLNYALLGAILGDLIGRRPVPAIVLTAALVGLLVHAAAGGAGLLPIDGVRPVWQLHALGAAVGLALGLAGGAELRSSGRSPRSSAPLPP